MNYNCLCYKYFYSYSCEDITRIRNKSPIKTCHGIFTDSFGSNKNYINNENYIMEFQPDPDN